MHSQIDTSRYYYLKNALFSFVSLRACTCPPSWDRRLVALTYLCSRCPGMACFHWLIPDSSGPLPECLHWCRCGDVPWCRDRRSWRQSRRPILPTPPILQVKGQRGHLQLRNDYSKIYNSIQMFFFLRQGIGSSAVSCSE